MVLGQWHPAPYNPSALGCLVASGKPPLACCYHVSMAGGFSQNRGTVVAPGAALSPAALFQVAGF